VPKSDTERNNGWQFEEPRSCVAALLALLRSGSLQGRHTLHFLFHDQPGEVFKRPVIRLFGIRWKKASWYLSLGEVILDAIATDSQPGAGRVCAGAKRLVSFEFFAFHENSRVDKTKLSSIRASSNRHVKSRICVDGGNVADTDIAKIRPNLYDSS